MTRVFRRSHGLRFLSTLGLFLFLLSGCITNSLESTSEPEARETLTPSPTAQQVVEATSVPTATLIPEIGLVNAADGDSLEITRHEDLNARGHYDEIRVADDGTRHLIPLEAIEWGGVAKDGIPSIDRPAYVGPDRWYEMVYDPDGLVIGVEVGGKYRAYPLQILIWHEIVNETFEGKHLLVTY